MTIESIRQRVAAATPGPWEALHPPVESWVRGPMSRYHNTGSMLGVVAIGKAMRHPDATFIAHARADIERLLAVAEAAAECMEMWRGLSVVPEVQALIDVLAALEAEP